MLFNIMTLNQMSFILIENEQNVIQLIGIQKGDMQQNDIQRSGIK